MIKQATQEAIEEAAILIRGGHLVAFPTETVYGLGADATNAGAVSRIFETKSRPQFNPLIVHVADIAMAHTLGQLSPEAEELCEQFWPGPLTIVVPRSPHCPASELVSAGLDTIALRCPDHPVATQLIARAGRPIAAPSANRSGRISPTRADHVADSLSGEELLILDGGPCRAGLESTVVQIAGNDLYILRHGAVSPDDIASADANIRIHTSTTEHSAPRSPGQLASHYAPNHPLRLDVETVDEREALLAFGGPCPGDPIETRNLSPSADLSEAAANFFAYLHELDRLDCDAIAVMPIPMTGLGLAINDRLTRAATAVE